MRKTLDAMRTYGINMAVVICLVLAGSFAQSQTQSVAQASKEEPSILVGAGDIADCRDLSGAEATARLLEQIPGTVMAVGDLAYPDGSRENFKCYERTWGRVKARTRPAAGNHELHATGATPYFEYFGPADGGPKHGCYS